MVLDQPYYQQVTTKGTSEEDLQEGVVEPIDSHGTFIEVEEKELQEVAIELGIEKPPVPVVEPTPADVFPACDDIRTFCTDHSIALVLKSLCERVPEALPNYTMWRGVSPLPGIYSKIHSKGYVENLMPALNLMMGSNILNVPWSARVVIAIATYDVVREMANG